MKIVILTQDDPYYLADNLRHLLEHIPGHSKVVGCVVFNVTPFGKKETFFDKMKRTWAVFGFKFFLRFGIKYILNKFEKAKDVKKTLKQYDIPIIELSSGVNSEESIKKIRFFNPDLLISIAGNELFKKALINLAPKGCLNLHSALLPKYRGLMPNFWVLKNNEQYTGVSVFFVDEGIDSGPILVQKKVEIGNRSLEELIRHTKKIGMDAIIEAIELIEKGGYELIENNSKLKTYYTFPTRKDVEGFLHAGKRFY